MPGRKKPGLKASGWPRRLMRDSIGSRIFLAVFGGLAVMQFVGFLLFTGERLHLLPLAQTREAETVAADTLAAVLRATAAERTAVAARLFINGGSAALVDRFAPSGQVFDPPPVHAFRDRLRSRLADQVDFILVETETPPEGATAIPGSPPKMPAGPPLQFRLWLRLSAQNHDGAAERRWLVLTLPAELLMRWDSAHVLLWWGLSLLATVPLSLLVARRLTAPIRRFSAAADRLGLDIDALPLPETGPAELRAATAAVNAMQRRLKRFVDDRTEMLAAISHDLRTPLSRLRLRVEGLPDCNERARLIADLKLLERMLAATLEFSRDASRGEPRCRIDLASLTESLCAERADLGQTATYAGPDYLEFTCRPMAIGRALRNLLDNAVEYGGGAMVALRDEGDGIAVEICDRGPGIPDGETERVFEPFYRLDAARSTEHEGTGLGLSIARNIARAHGGDVILANRPEGGLSATLKLPRAEDLA
jgi:signal transduction histidine kinase